MTENDSRIILQDYLQRLVGLPLSIVRDAESMKGFHFGTIRPHPAGRGTVGAYTFHIQCPWRLVSENKIITGASDRFIEPQGKTEVDHDDHRSGNMQLVRIATLLEKYDEATKSYIDTTGQLIVMSVNADTYGGVDLLLSGGYRLQIFPDGSLEEDWRFIDLEGPHTVIEGGQVQIDE